MIDLDPSMTLRLQWGAEHLHDLGPRALAEFLIEISSDPGDLIRIIERLTMYRNRLSTEMVRLAGGDRFPQRIPLVVPQ